MIALAARLYGQHQSSNAVANRMRISRPTVSVLLKAAGVTLLDKQEVSRRQRKLKGAVAAQAAADYAAGMKEDDLKNKYGVGKCAIRTAARAEGIDRRSLNGRSRIFSEGDQKEIERLYADGWSQETIAMRFGASQQTIRRRLIASGTELRPTIRRMEKHGSWKGGRVRLSAGYVGIMVEASDPLHSMADCNGYVMEHRLVMARSLGRPLYRHETVHHINGDRADNGLNNLQLRFGKHGKGVAMTCAKCGSHEITYTKLA